MKKVLLLIGIFALLNNFAHAQQADMNAIALTPYVADNSGVPPASTKALETKLTNLITAAGMKASPNQRFILTGHVVVLTEDVTPTAPPQYVYTLGINLYMGDGMTGNLYSSADFEAKGVGNTKDKAYLMALKNLNPRDPRLKAMLQEGEQKIIDYYLSQGPSIISSAQALANNQEYDQALYVLDQIPSACPDLYAKANEVKMQIYNKQIAEDGASALAEARSIWSAGQDRAAADRAGAILATINPQSPAYKEAQTLSTQIAAKIKAMDDREWNFKLQQQKDETALKKQALQAARDVAVERARNQPKTIYKIYWW